MRRLLLFLPLAVAAAILGVSARYLLDEEAVEAADTLPSALVGRPAPAFDLPPPESVEVPGLATADLAAGEVTAFNVFASWCVPCRAEHGVLTRLAEEEGLRLVGLAYRDEAEGTAAFLAELGNPYERIGFDAAGRTGIEWGVTGVPETFLLGPDGTVLHRHVGPIVGEPAVSDFREALEEVRAATGGGA